MLFCNKKRKSQLRIVFLSRLFSFLLIQVHCNEERIPLESLLESSNDLPVDCRLELENLLLLAGFCDLKPTNLYNYTICSNHQKALHNVRHRRRICHLCIDVLHKAKRSNAFLQRVTKALAIRIWIVHRINTLDLILMNTCINDSS